MPLRMRSTRGSRSNTRRGKWGAPTGEPYRNGLSATPDDTSRDDANWYDANWQDRWGERPGCSHRPCGDGPGGQKMGGAHRPKGGTDGTRRERHRRGDRERRRRGGGPPRRGRLHRRHVRRLLSLDQVLSRSLRLSPQVGLRPESFGAMSYHYGTRRLSFLKD